MSSTPTQTSDGNPRKRRRLNKNLATTDRMQVIMGIEKRKVEKLKQELSQAMMDKDGALKELGEIKSETISQLKHKNGEITKLQDKLQTIFNENGELKQQDHTLRHKLEIFESQIDSLQKENFKLRAQIYKKSQTTLPTISNGVSTSDRLSHSLKKEIALKDATISGQNEEIIRLESQIKAMDANNLENTGSLQQASKHIARLQAQLAQKTEAQSDFAQSEMESIRHGFERKIRLLEDSVRHYKTDNVKLQTVSEEYQVTKDKYTQLKEKYVELMQLNTKYEPIYNELNEWKKIIRAMCLTLFPDCEYLLDNEYQLKVALNDLNQKYILLVQQRDEYRSNMLSIKEQWIAGEKELAQMKLKHSKQMDIHHKSVQKMNEITKQLRQVKIESKSYKNVLNTYNVMSPSKHSEQQHITNLFEENKNLMERIQTMEHEKQRVSRNMEQMEIENARLSQRVNNGEYNSLNTKVLSFKNNPLRLAMDRLKNENKERIKDLEKQLAEIRDKKETKKNEWTVNGNTDANANASVYDKSEIYYELENKYNILIKKMSMKEQEMKQMKEELSSANKINQRMKSLFGKKAGEYRERIYQMTGYNICLLGDGKHYRLQHLWMNEEDDEIILQIDKLGQLQLKDTEFMRSKMDKGLLKKLKQTRSLPIFLSELTLWLYRDDEDQ